MGIPYYFKNVVRRNPGVVKSKVHQCDRLYLDFNSVIHTCSQKVVASKPWRNPHAMEQAIFRQIIQYTEYIVGTCPPKQLLYIGVDGVAPVAKIVQQRRRRHMSALRNGWINNFKQTNRIPYSEWDSNCITPGTPFMIRLQEALATYFLQQKRTYEVRISSHEEVGEGEHKIIQYIKSLGEDGFTDVIYGLDADLMMLTLTCGKSKMYLMRESNQVSRSHHQHNTTPFKYVDIDYLVKCTCGSKSKMFLYSYVFVCFFLGNDFLPHFPALSISTNGLDTLTTILEAIEAQHGYHALAVKDDKYVINVDFLSCFLKMLAEREEGLITFNIKAHEQKCTAPVDMSAPSPLERVLKEIEALPVTEFAKHRVQWNPANDQGGWKHVYYLDEAGKKSNDVTEMDNMCLNFLQGLYWNVDYYFNNTFSNAWYYNSRTAPCLTDLSYYLQKLSVSDSMDRLVAYKESLNVNITPIHQLMMVLPIQSLGLLPQKYTKHLLDWRNGLSHMYPTSFEINMALKTQLWECYPILPSLDIDKIINLNI